jgi:hypothetical protein
MEDKMKKLLFIFMFIAFSIHSEKSFSWDSTAAKFFPLAVGNSWSYLYRLYNGPNGCAFPTQTYNYIITITKDSIINGHKYYRFSDGKMLRIDSATMNVYKFLSVGNECKTDSLLAKLNNMVQGCELWGPISDTNAVTFAGQNRRTRNQQGIGYSKRLMYGIGLYYDGGCELNYGYNHNLNGCIINGVQYGQMLGITQTTSEVPNEFSLLQNYPNPFNPTTKLKFQMPKLGLAKLVVYDLLGKEIQLLVNQQLSPGTYEVDFDGSNLPSGVYYYKLESGTYTETKKMILIK